MSSKLPYWTDLKSYINVVNPDGETEEWAIAAAHRLLTPWINDRVKFAFNDPDQFNAKGTVKPSAFAKVLKQLGPNGTLSQDKLVVLIETFISKCSQTDWVNFYQPILKRKKELYLTEMSIGWFNSIAPDEYFIELFPPQSYKVAYPSVAGYYYPFCEDNTRVFIVIWEDHIECLDRFCCSLDSGDFKYHIPTSLMKQPDLNYPIILEGYQDGGYQTLMLTDAFELKHIGVWPGALRRQVLEDLYMRFLDDVKVFDLGEGYPAAPDADLDEVGQHLFNLGYKSMNQALFKSALGLYTDHAIIVPLHHAVALDPYE